MVVDLKDLMEVVLLLGDGIVIEDDFRKFIIFYGVEVDEVLKVYK